MQSNWQKKMATLDLEIALTQNMYNSLISAKGRSNNKMNIELNNMSMEESRSESAQ